MAIGNDPRYQRALQMARARAQFGNRPRTAGITSAYAARNQQKDLAFQRLGLRRFQQKAALRKADFALRYEKMVGDEGLRQMDRRVAFEKRGIRAIKSARSTAKTATMMGLGVSVMAGMEGRSRKKKLEAQAAEQTEFNRGILSALRSRRI